MSAHLKSIEASIRSIQKDIRFMRQSEEPAVNEAVARNEDDTVHVELKDREGHLVQVGKLPRQHKLTDAEHWARTERVIRQLNDKNIKLTTNNVKLCGVGAGTFHKLRAKAKNFIATLERARDAVQCAAAAADSYYNSALPVAKLHTTDSEPEDPESKIATLPLRPRSHLSPSFAQAAFEAGWGDGPSPFSLSQETDPQYGLLLQFPMSQLGYHPDFDPESDQQAFRLPLQWETETQSGIGGSVSLPAGSCQ
jgi:hypothetical protein